MSKLLALVGATAVGWLGWWLGAYVGTVTAFALGMLGTGIGIYGGRRLARHLGG